MWKQIKKIKWSCFCCVGHSCEGVQLDSSQWLPLQCKLCLNNNDVNFDKNEIFLNVHVKTAFVLTSIVRVNFWTLFDDEGILCILYVVRNMGPFTYSECHNVHLSVLWSAHFGMRSCRDAQLLCCSHLLDPTSIVLIFQVNMISQGSFFENKT